MPFDMSYAGAPGRLKDRCARIRMRGDAQFAKQAVHLFRWQTLAEIFYPERANFTSEINGGDDLYTGIYTSHPQILRRQMADRVNAMTRPKGQQWFKCVALPEERMENDEAKRWCETSTKRQRRVVESPKAGFYRAMAEGDNDYVTFGNAVLCYGYNRDKSGLFFRTVHLRDCAWAESSERIINEMHEKMELTLAQAVEMFGADKLPRAWKEQAEDTKNLSTTVKVRRSVMPADDYAFRDEALPKGTKFLSVYIACGAGVEDSECGLREEYLGYFPYSVRRWMTVSGDVYARSPAADVALADGRTLNTAAAAALKGIEFTADPAYTAPDDGIMGEVELRAGTVTYIDSEMYKATGTRKFLDKIEGGEPRTALEYIAMQARQMAVAFYMDLLTLPQQQAGMTLGEFTQRFRVALRDAAPVFEPIVADYSMLMEGVFFLILNAHGPADPWGGFEPGPEVLSEAETQFEFQTALTEAYTELKRAEALEVTLQYADLRKIGSDAADNIDMDQVVRDSLSNFNAKWTRTVDEVAAARERREKQMAAERAAAETAAVADMAMKANPEQYRQVKQDIQEAA